MILTREQIDAAERDGEYIDVDMWATARAYHDLRDAVLALCDARPPWGCVQVDELREVVARVERGES